LDRRGFEVFDIYLGDPFDESAAAIGATADHYLALGKLPVCRLQDQIAELKLDVAIYTDIGMGHISFRLAFSRLAPVQCVTWGHPDTTGIPTLDYFLSCDALEPVEAENEYTENLIRLRRVNSYYLPPAIPSRTPSKQDMGIPEEWHVYAIPQSLFKIHPDFDSVMEQILLRDSAAHIVFISDPRGVWTGLLERRLRRHSPVFEGRIHFTPRLNYSGFFSLAGAADVVLDVPQFSGGNTTYEAFSIGAPIVTRPGRFMRGRLTAALYQMMGLGNLVCDDDTGYVDTAVKLGTDAGERLDWRQKIESARPALYEDSLALAELEDFLLQALESRV
jgi:predicted O-linked N-acetylglucosamine transferase (SPINDLY family)